MDAKEISDETLETITPASNDLLVVYDTSTGTTGKATLADIAPVVAENIDIDDLSTVTPAAADSLMIYDASADTTGKATLADIAPVVAENIDIDDLSTVTPAADDALMIRDTSAGTTGKATLEQISSITSLSIVATSTTITGRPLITNTSIKITFIADITGSDTSTPLSFSYNGSSYNVKIGKHGILSSVYAHEVSSGVYKFLQAYTTLELIYDGTQFIIVGNPIMLSSSDYTIYADGEKTEEQVTVTCTNPNVTILKSFKLSPKTVFVLGYINKDTSLTFGDGQVSLGVLSVNGATLYSAQYPTSIFLFANNFGTKPAVWKSNAGWLTVGENYNGTITLGENAFFEVLLRLA